MAEGSDSVASADASLENPNDFTCTRCTNADQISVEASHYCPQCDIFYCRRCLQYVCDHGILGRSKVKKWGQKLVEKEKCLSHPRETLKMFCGDHDMLCCYTCVSLDHRQCQNMQYIPEAAKNFASGNHLQLVKVALQQIQSKVDLLHNSCLSKLATTEKLNNDIISSIRECRQKINALLDDLEQQSTEEINKFAKQQNDTIKNNLQRCEETKADLAKFQSKMENLVDCNESQIFIQLKKCKEWVAKTDKLLDNIGCTKVHESLQFYCHSMIEETLNSLTGIGHLVNLPYKVTGLTSSIVKMQGDSSARCNIYSICQLVNGNIVMNDYGHERIIQLDTTFKAINHYTYPSGTPYCLCRVNDKEVAVCYSSRSIQFLYVGTKILSRNSFSVGFSCFGLAHHGEHLYLTNRSCNVYQYSLSGTPLQSFTKDKTGKQLFSKTQHIAISPGGTTIYVADTEKGLVTIDNQGNHLTTFNPPGLTGVDTVCLDQAGNVFVSKNKSIFQLETKGDNVVTELLNSVSDLTFSPVSIYFDRKNFRLIVGGRNDEVTCFQLEKNAVKTCIDSK